MLKLLVFHRQEILRKGSSRRIDMHSRSSTGCGTISHIGIACLDLTGPRGADRCTGVLGCPVACSPSYRRRCTNRRRCRGPEVTTYDMAHAVVATQRGQPSSTRKAGVAHVGALCGMCSTSTFAITAYRIIGIQPGLPIHVNGVRSTHS
jgi:hypothetical protein